MSRYIARIIRALFVSCVGFGGGVGLMVFIVTLVVKGDQHAFRYGLNAGLLLGSIFAIFLTGVMLPLDLAAKIFLSKGKYKEIWELVQTREMDFEGTFKDVVAACRQALLAVPYMKAVTEDLDSNVIAGSVGMSWRSPGEKVEVKISPLSENRWHLRCISTSPSDNVVFDYGKNFENVETWLQTMTAEAKS